MNPSKPNNRGQGNNQSADALKIPTLGSTPPMNFDNAGSNNADGPILQPGEDAAAMASFNAGAASGDSLNDFIDSANGGDLEQDESSGDRIVSGLGNAAPPPSGPAPGITSAPVAREMSNAEITQVMQMMQAQQLTMMQMFERVMTGTQAMHRPVHLGNDRNFQEAEVPNLSLDVPGLDRDLDQMRRPDQRIEGVDIDVVADMKHAEMLAFMEEYVAITIHETGEEGAENPVVLGINGRNVAIPRGTNVAVRRKYVEMLLRAKPESIKTRITRGGDGEPRNHIDKSRSLKYPFSIMYDRNQRGRAWAQKIRSEG